MPLEKYSSDAIERAKNGATDWLSENLDGYPRSWVQEIADDTRRGYIMYDDFEAPPIAGYEELEREGVAARHGVVAKDGQERIHFHLVVKQ